VSNLGEATIDIGCEPGFAWTLLADPRLASEWVLGVADAEILALDGDDRPTRVRFTGMPSAASLEYEMAYEYDAAGLRLRWHTVGDTDRALDGEAWIEALGPGSCRLHYQMAARPSRALPSWARDTLADDTPTKVVAAFRRFVERRASRCPG
jgi:hypothetical protein